MDLLTLELFDVPVSRALSEVNRALEEHPHMPIRVLLEGEEMLLHNLLRFLERQERKVTQTPLGSIWQLDIAPMPKPAETLRPLPAPIVAAHPPQRPLLVFRSAFTPGDRALGRRLLLGVLRSVDPGIPWIGLAHEALELLEDPAALELLYSLRARGVRIRISRDSLRFQARDHGGFELLEDEEWQTLMARGGLVAL